MVTSAATTVDEYLWDLEPDRAAALARIRAIILDVAPDVTETMKYRMPTYECGQGALCAMASQKQYLSLYVEPRILDRHRNDFSHLNLGRSCIRFRRIGTLPLNTVRAILAETVAQLDSVSAAEEQ